MMRYKLNPVIFLINNGGYTIEVEIHDGPYNVIKNWDYVKLIEAIDNNGNGAYAVRVGSPCYHALPCTV
jgi:pyruvate decarboxylase